MTAKPAKMPAPEAPENLQGFVVDATEAQRLRDAIELAFDYRGDVTIVRKSASSVEGYLFDRHADTVTGDIVVRIIPTNSEVRVSIPISDIVSIAFTGKDNASGKSFENWIRKYAQKKLAGESASIESEPLD